MPSEENLQPTTNEVNSEELESMKRRLAEFENRQKEFDDLRHRIDAHERHKADDAGVEKRSKVDSADVDIGHDIDQKLLDDHRESIRKMFTRQSDINLSDLHKEYLKKKIERWGNLTLWVFFPNRVGLSIGFEKKFITCGLFSWLHK